jgi:hypothetical protein
MTSSSLHKQTADSRTSEQMVSAIKKTRNALVGISILARDVPSSYMRVGETAGALRPTIS